MKVLVLGASGMLGNAMLRILSETMDVYATARSRSVLRHFAPQIQDRILSGIDVDSSDAMIELFRKVQPSVVVNCIGLVKQLADADDPLSALPINSMLPHRLAKMCALIDARLIHISTDCVFAGTRGAYTEADISDATDLYGKSKYIGEVDYPHATTLRTSIIGHELEGSHGLVGWFLSQEGAVRGYSRAIFSGLPTVELARVVRNVVIPNTRLTGVYHVASEPISKLNLLKLVAKQYGKVIEIVPDEAVIIDRSLNADRFHLATGYRAPAWPELVKAMHDFR